jgi:hypothetical protein
VKTSWLKAQNRSILSRVTLKLHEVVPLVMWHKLATLVSSDAPSIGADFRPILIRHVEFTLKEMVI